MTDAWEPHLDALGALIRQQRQLAGHSLRDLAGMTDISSAYPLPLKPRPPVVTTPDPREFQI